MNPPNYSEYGVERVAESDGREEFDPRATPNSLAKKIQVAVDSIISECDDVDWSEDSISLSIVKELRNILMHYKIPDVHSIASENKFNFEAYKLTGKAEQSHGDIAFVISRKVLGRDPVSGVAFYEAKASGLGYESDRYPSFNIQQLRRLTSNTPKLSYLIYNRVKRRIEENDWPMYTLDYRDEKYGYSFGNLINAITIDANFLKQCRSISAASTAVGQSFGEHFVKRVLSGRDLDYSRSVDNTIRRWLKITKRSAPLIVSVSVFEEQDENFSAHLELPNFEKMKFPEMSFKKLPSDGAEM